MRENSGKYRTRFGYARALVLTLALVVAGGFGSLVSGVAFGQENRAQQLPSPADLSRVFIDVAKKVRPAVVHIEVEEKARRASGRRFEGFPQIPGFPFPFEEVPRRRQGTGSGVIVSPDGYILTNDHVVGEASEIKVKLADGRELKARRIGTDPETDLAVIKVEATGLPYAKLGDSDKVEQGEWVLALGSPFGLQQTMTAGIVSAIGRDIPTAGQFVNFIQTDASINPGNSGGPLVNMQGEVIGINSQIYSRTGGNDGVGFAIPSNVASKVQAQLIKSGKVTRAYLGIYLQDVTPAIARTAGYEGTEGVLVRDVTDTTTPAARAGLRSGDIITEFDGKPVKSPKQLTDLVANTPVGKEVTIKYVRDGRMETATIRLAERPSARQEGPENGGDEGEPDTGRLGITVEPLTPELADQLKPKISTGVVISSVQPDSPAAEAGLRRGDVIHRIGRTSVTSRQSLVSALTALKDQKEVALQISRGGQLLFVTVTFE
ncbi:MAG TPA: DegQ family serine endoprotease [Blastocatellia bacterium]|nr:DegQ family serine endoprotease [Blastocatellia bacterium]